VEAAKALGGSFKLTRVRQTDRRQTESSLNAPGAGNNKQIGQRDINDLRTVVGLKSNHSCNHRLIFYLSK